MTRRRQRLAASALAACMALGGCIGNFKLTGAVYKKNRSLENRWAQEGIFLCLVIVPVYEVTLIADLLVMNAIDFFSGPEYGESESSEP